MQIYAFFGGGGTKHFGPDAILSTNFLKNMPNPKNNTTSTLN